MTQQGWAILCYCQISMVGTCKFVGLHSTCNIGKGPGNTKLANIGIQYVKALEAR